MPTSKPTASTAPRPTVTTDSKKADAEKAMQRLKTLHQLCYSRLLSEHPGAPGLLEATLSMRQVRAMFSDEDLAKRYPLILTYAQAAELVQVSVNTLKGWLSQGRYADCVRRGNPGRVARDEFVQMFMRDEFGINDE